MRRSTRKRILATASLGAVTTAIIFLDQGEGAIGKSVARLGTPPGQAPTFAPDNGVMLSDSFAKAAQRVAPAVVSVISVKYFTVSNEMLPFGVPEDAEAADKPSERDPKKPRRFKKEGLGSGIIVSSDGYILTNFHVVKEHDRLKVLLADQRDYQAKVVGTDERTDLAVIKIEADELPVAALGNSNSARVGEWVLAIGSSYGLPQTVTAGIISAKSRRGLMGPGSYEDFIQTDAAINRGDSGGPLVNLRGEVIGLNTAIYSESGGNAGIGFAVPATIMREVLPNLLAGRPIVRGQLGVVIQQLSVELAQQFGVERNSGVVITQINKGSPADTAGLKPGDVIVCYDGMPVGDAGELRNRFAASEPGSSVPIIIIRHSKEMTVVADIGRTADSGASVASGKKATAKPGLGFDVKDLTPETAEKLDMSEEHGVVVVNLDPVSLAYDRGIREGDLIAEVNRESVRNVDDFRRLISGSRNSTLFLVKNSEGSRFVVLPQK